MNRTNSNVKDYGESVFKIGVLNSSTLLVGLLHCILCFSGCVPRSDNTEFCEEAFVKVKTSSGSIGSGFFVNDSLILTNYHVIAMDYNPIYYIGKDTTTVFQTKGIFYYNELFDLALLSVKEKSSCTLQIADNPIHPCDSIFNISSPLGSQFTELRGVAEDTAAPKLILQINAQKGSSGSPILNHQNKVIGVISQSRQRMQGFCKAINLHILKRFLSEAFEAPLSINRPRLLFEIYTSLNRHGLYQSNLSQATCCKSLPFRFLLIKQLEKLHRRLQFAGEFHLKPYYFSINDMGDWLLFFSDGSISFSSIPADFYGIYNLVKEDGYPTICAAINSKRDWILINSVSAFSNKASITNILRNPANSGISYTQICSEGNSFYLRSKEAGCSLRIDVSSLN